MVKSISESAAKELESTFKEGIELITKLGLTLDNERTALEQQDTHELNKLSSLKYSQLDKISIQDAKMNDILVRHGIPKSDNAVDTLLNLFPVEQQTPLFKLWEQMKSGLKACQDKNTINGRIIDRSRFVVQHLLSVINLGDQAHPPLYKANGKAGTNDGSRPIAKA